MAQASAAASAEAKRTAAVAEERKVEFAQGPLSVLLKAAKSGEKVLIGLRNNHKLMASVKAFDRHCNMVLEDVSEIWTEPPRTAGGKPTAQSRVVNKMFLRGDSVIIVVRNS